MDTYFPMIFIISRSLCKRLPEGNPNPGCSSSQCHDSPCESRLENFTRSKRWCSIQVVCEKGYPDVKRGYIQSMLFHWVFSPQHMHPEVYIHIYIYIYIYKCIYIYVCIYLCCLRMGDPYFTILAGIQFDYLTVS